jgi:hypothetical protein
MCSDFAHAFDFVAENMDKEVRVGAESTKQCQGAANTLSTVLKSGTEFF